MAEQSVNGKTTDIFARIDIDNNSNIEICFFYYYWLNNKKLGMFF